MDIYKSLCTRTLPSVWGFVSSLGPSNVNTMTRSRRLYFASNRCAVPESGTQPRMSAAELRRRSAP